MIANWHDIKSEWVLHYKVSLSMLQSSTGKVYSLIQLHLEMGDS